MDRVHHLEVILLFEQDISLSADPSWAITPSVVQKGIQQNFLLKSIDIPKESTIIDINSQFVMFLSVQLGHY